MKLSLSLTLLLISLTTNTLKPTINDPSSITMSIVNAYNAVFGKDNLITENISASDAIKWNQSMDGAANYITQELEIAANPEKEPLVKTSKFDLKNIVTKIKKDIPETIQKKLDALFKTKESEKKATKTNNQEIISALKSLNIPQMLQASSAIIKLLQTNFILTIKPGLKEKKEEGVRLNNTMLDFLKNPNSFPDSSKPELAGQIEKITSTLDSAYFSKLIKTANSNLETMIITLRGTLNSIQTITKELNDIALTTEQQKNIATVANFALLHIENSIETILKNYQTLKETIEYLEKLEQSKKKTKKPIPATIPSEEPIKKPTPSEPSAPKENLTKTIQALNTFSQELQKLTQALG